LACLRCNVTQFILSGNCSTYSGWYCHPSSGAQTTVSTASGISHTVNAACLYRGRAGTGLRVLWMVYGTRSNGICHTGLRTACKQDQDGTSWSCLQAVKIPLLCVQWNTPNDGQRNCSKHVEFHSKIKLRN
jgi:hypothetical protein